MANDLIYVYCLLKKLPAGLPGMAQGKLHSITACGFHVVVKAVSPDEFSEENLKKNLSDVQWLDINAREHIGVIGILMKQSDVIPFNFGTIFETEENLKKFITEYSGSLSDNLEYISGKEEWSIKIYCNLKVITEQIDELSTEAADLEKQIMASSPGKAFLLKRKKADLIENELNRLLKIYGQEYFNEIRDLSEDTTLNNLLPKELTGREDSMILNAAFLVLKEKSDVLTSVLASLQKKYQHLGLNSEVSGPWPPYSFVAIKENH